MNPPQDHLFSAVPTSTPADSATHSAASSLSSMNSVCMFPHLPGAAAPLPSPTAATAATGDKDNYFSPRQPQAEHPIFTQQQQQLHNQQQQHSATQHQWDEAQRGGNVAVEDTEASKRLKDCNLLAEAAKRAQIACVTRDLEEVQL